MQSEIEVPLNYHQYHDFPQLLEQHYIQKLRKDQYDYLASTGQIEDIGPETNYNNIRIEYEPKHRLKIF